MQHVGRKGVGSGKISFSLWSIDRDGVSTLKNDGQNTTQLVFYQFGPNQQSALQAHCRAIIPKGSTRVVTHAFLRPNRATRFYRCASTCIDAAFATAVLRRHKRAQHVPATADVPDDELSTIRRAFDRLGAASSAPRSSAPQCTQSPTSPPPDERQAPIERFLLVACRTPCNPQGSSYPRHRTE